MGLVALFRAQVLLRRCLQLRLTGVGMLFRFQGFLVLGDIGYAGVLRRRGRQCLQGFLRVLRVEFHSVLFRESLNNRIRVAVAFRRFLILGRSVAKEVVAFPEQPVVGPVGGRRAYGHHGDPVYREHDHREDGEPQPAVGNHLVDLVGCAQAARVVLPVAGLDHLRDVDVPLVGNDAFRVVVQFLLRGGNVRLDMLPGLLGNLKLLQYLVVPFEYLDGIPALLLFRHIVHRRFLNVRQRMLHRAGEGVLRYGFSALGRLNRRLRGFHNPGALQCGYLCYPAAQLPGKVCGVQLVPVFLHHVHHVDGNHHRDPQLHQLGGQVQVPLQVRAVDDVQDGVRPLTDQVVPGHNFLQRIGRQTVDARQVRDDDALMLPQLSFLLLHGHPGPVANELVGSRQGIEQGRFPAVWVACQGNANIHRVFLLFGESN